jgi:FkbM family methyltransferase
MLADGRYETAELDPLLSWVSTNAFRPTAEVAVEVGANVGTTTVPLARRGHRVVAFEPVPRLRSLLIENLIANDLLDRVIVESSAIADIEGSLNMRESDSGGSEIVTDSAASIRARRGESYFSGRQAADVDKRRTIAVPVQTLDGALTSLKIKPEDVAVVWSDTEGAEAGVIRGGSHLWSDGVPLWVETWPAGLEEHGGVDTFMNAVKEHFSNFVSHHDLVVDGADARIQPLDRLEALLVRALREEATWWSTDVLLVPKS